MPHGGTLAHERLYVLLPFDVAESVKKLPASGNAFVALSRNPQNTERTRPKVLTSFLPLLPFMHSQLEANLQSTLYVDGGCGKGAARLAMVETAQSALCGGGVCRE